MRKITKLWTTKSGEKIRICDMSDKHLKNTIKMLEKKAIYIKLEIPFPNFQGEMAQYCAEQEYWSIQDADPEELIPILDDLYNEKMRREL